ncbi:MAG: hypothetical protein ACLP0H_02705, partial [Terriglobales bacterium]
QQASKGNGEKRHRELWPAYNVNAAPPQASTEGLFQQTRLFTTAILVLSSSGQPISIAFAEEGARWAHSLECL